MISTGRNFRKGPRAFDPRFLPASESLVSGWLPADVYNGFNLANLVHNGSQLGGAVGSPPPVVTTKNMTINGRWSAKFTSSSSNNFSAQRNSGPIKVPMIYGNDRPGSALWVGRFSDVLQTAPMWALYGILASTTTIFSFVIDSGQWTIRKRDDTGAEVLVRGGIADANWHVFQVNHSGLVTSLYIDGVAVAANVSQDVGLFSASPTNGFSIASDGAIGIYCSCEWATWWGYDRWLDPLELAVHCQQARNFYSI